MPAAPIHIAAPAYHLAADNVVKPTGAPGTVLVKLPADASLFVDGAPTSLSSDSRRFQTPPLEAGKDYYYTVRIEAMRNGEKVTQSQRVIVRAGHSAEVAFAEFEVAAKGEPAKTEPVKAPAKVIVKLPSEAKLYVDGVLCPQSSAVRSFETPKLDPNVTYGYTLKAEVVRNGQTKTEMKRIEIQAGKEVSVDFGDMSGVTAASR